MRLPRGPFVVNRILFTKLHKTSAIFIFAASANFRSFRKFCTPESLEYTGVYLFTLCSGASTFISCAYLTCQVWYKAWFQGRFNVIKSDIDPRWCGGLTFCAKVSPWFVEWNKRFRENFRQNEITPFCRKWPFDMRWTLPLLFNPQTIMGQLIHGQISRKRPYYI